MIRFFEINNIAFSAFGYPLSYIELIGTFAGLFSVFFASRENIWTWPTGMINVFFLGILFYQVQLYPDMFLQIYFFVVNAYGWYNWSKSPSHNDIKELNFRERFIGLILIIIFTILSGIFFSKIHLLLPAYFHLPASFPYADSLILVMSITATWLLARKIIENWHLWIIIDVISIILYFKKGILFLAVEYGIFLVIATYGLIYWKKNFKHD